MNAPWKPGISGTRDPFAAFICDESSLDIVRGLAVNMGWPTEKCHKGGLRNAVQSLSVTASPNILLVDLSESGDPLNDINALAEVCEPGTVVIAMGQVNDVRLYRDLISSGLHDYLLKPVGPEQLRDTVMQAQAVLTAPKPGEVVADRTHIGVMVIGTRGGVGGSTVATSLAWQLSKYSGRMTALLDLDLHFGTGALTMDLEPGRGLTDAIDNPSRIDGLFIERAMIKANDKLSILSAEAPISAPLMTDGAAFFQLKEEFRHAFEATVVDLPRQMLIDYPHLVSDTNIAILVTELTLASARDAIRLLAWLKSNAPVARILVVANKVQPAALEITRADFETTIEHKIDFLIPADLKTAAQAAKLGQPFCEAGKSSKAGVVMKALTERCLGLADEEVVTEKDKGGAKKSLLGKFSDFRSLLPAKPAKAK
ncbi:pilus assembly protein CpaE [Blastomonas sp.]|uniref:nucleotide-binding protein n=1 Tax=Blastomonas sp. TaxID=1909299 RepID=UPI003593CC1F